MNCKKKYKGNQFLVFYGQDDFIAFIAENVIEACIVLKIEITDRNIHNMTSRIGQAIKNNGHIIIGNDRYCVRTQRNER